MEGGGRGEVGAGGGAVGAGRQARGVGGEAAEPVEEAEEILRLVPADPGLPAKEAATHGLEQPGDPGA